MPDKSSKKPEALEPQTIPFIESLSGTRPNDSLYTPLNQDVMPKIVVHCHAHTHSLTPMDKSLPTKLSNTTPGNHASVTPYQTEDLNHCYQCSQSSDIHDWDIEDLGNFYQCFQNSGHNWGTQGFGLSL